MKVSHTFVADGNAMIIGFGFIPSEIHAIAALGGTELRYDWYKVLSDAEASGRYGIKDDGAGALTVSTAEADGFAEYDSVTNGVMIESPKPGVGLIEAAVSDWAASTAATARTATAIGTIVRPTTHNGYIYECTTSGTGHTTEPTWPTVPGDTVTEGAGSIVWTCREETVANTGTKGITIGATISTDSDVWVITAETHDKFTDKGDSGDVAANQVI